MENKKISISTVQELMNNSKGKDRGIEMESTVPERFVSKQHSADEADSNGVASMEVPVIDLALLSSTPHHHEELLKFHSALCSWGCFQVVNHGVEVSFLDQVREMAKQFFAQPSEEKLKYLRADDGIEGYGNDMVLSDQQVVDWNDRLYLSVYPEDHQKLEFWPQKPENFRQTLHDYTLKLKQITELVFKAMAQSLNIKTDTFLEQYGETGTMFARFNLYPRCPRPEQVYGLKPHNDGSAITILLPDKEVEGLQFLRDGKWFRVPIIPHALLINIGDQVEIMSNGVFKSPTHRALTSSQCDRISIAMFCAPEADREIGPAEGLVDDSRPRMYKTVKNYPEIFFHYYQQGKRPIDSVKL